MSNIFDKAKVLIKENRREDLFSLFKNLKGKLPPFKNTLSEKEVLSLIGKDIYRDIRVECYFPSVVRERKFVALSSLCTGDCLYSSVSLSLFGNNDFCDELRILTCIELFLNARFYSKHSVIESAYENNKSVFSDYMSVFTTRIFLRHF